MNWVCLTLNAPIATKVVCFSHLLKCLRSLYGKQCGPRSDCSYMLFASILNWSVMFGNYLQQKTFSGSFFSWRLKGSLTLPPGKLFMLFVVCWFFSNSTFSKNSSKIIIWVSNRLDRDQARCFVWKSYLQTTLGDKELNMHVQLSSWAG